MRVTTGLLVVGSGSAGVSAAQAYRELQPDAQIQILTSDRDVPYARPPLSKEFLRGDGGDIALHPPDWYREQSITVTCGVTVDTIDVDQKTLTAGGRRFGYEALVLACGASPAPLPLPGAARALPLRSASDARRLREMAARAETAVVIGAGFIGCEAAASLASRGVSVTLVAPDPAPQVKRLGDAAGRRLQGLVERTGARFLGNTRVAAIQQDCVVLDDGTRLAADLVLAATGVAPQSALAEDAGLEVLNSRIVVGGDMRTSAPDVYAAGDVALAFNAAAGRHLAVEHWQDADDQGRVAGTVAGGGAAQWQSVPGFWSEIGQATVKYHAWGDGYDRARLVEHGGGFTIWYTDATGITVGVLTHNADDDYDAGANLIELHVAPSP